MNLNLEDKSKKIIPGYIPPNIDELFSSWIFRLAIAQKLKPFTFTKFYFNETAFWNRDVDKFLYWPVIHELSKITPLSTDEILKHHLVSFSGIVFNGIISPSFTLGITKLGIFHRMRTINGLVVCTGCLEKHSYFRKHWRLMTSLICLECNKFLIDQCPCCHSPIVFQRLEIGDKSNFKELPVYLCWKCGYDLRKINNNIEQKSLLIEYQRKIDSCIDLGFTDQTGYSFLYFQVLLVILSKSQSKSKNWMRVREAFVKELKLNISSQHKFDVHLNLQSRIELLPNIFYLLEDLENRFVPFCKKYNLRYSDFAKDVDNLPFWFSRIFKEFY